MAMSGGSQNGRGLSDYDDDEEIVADINVTPLIDIMLVLLILFMVTSSVSLDSGLDIDIPKSEITKKSSSQDKAIIVSLDQEGNYFVQGQTIPFIEIQQAIQSAIQEEKTSTVIFEGDRAVTLDDTIGIMDLAKKAGATKFAIAADNK